MSENIFRVILIVITAAGFGATGYQVGKDNGKLEERNYQAALEQKVNAEMKAAGFCKWAEEGCK